MTELLLWLYLVNAVLLINHEIDSACWREWELFHLPGGRTGFLLAHFPLLFLVLYGLVLLSRGSLGGMIISLLLSLSGLFAFIIHMTFIAKGRKEFRAALSLVILGGTLILSIIQGWVTISLLMSGSAG